MCFSHYITMVKTGLKIYANSPIFTDKKRRAIIAQAGSRRFFLFQRCTLADITDFLTGVLTLLLGDFFPDQQFIPDNNADNLDILNYIVQENGKWTLDIEAMSRSKEKPIASLIHEEISLWDKEKARKKYGCADIIRFFIDVENERFFAEFTKLKNANLVNIDKDAVREKFLQELLGENQMLKPLWEDWDFSKLVMHKPHTIYKAFCYYAHRYYTLLGFGLLKLAEEDMSALKKCDTEKLFLAGRLLCDSIVKEQLSDIKESSMDFLYKLFEDVHKTLESVPAGSSIYSPTDVDVFITQFRGYIPDLFKNHRNEFGETDKKNAVIVDHNKDIYNLKEKKTINNYMDGIWQYVNDKDKYYELRFFGSYRDKIIFLYERIFSSSFRGYYSKPELEMIEGLYRKQLPHESPDAPSGIDEGKDSLSGHEKIVDPKNPLIDERFSWKVFFTDVFRNEFNESQMKEFLEYIPDHFNKFPFTYEEGSEVYLEMTTYSENEFYHKYCSFFKPNLPEDDYIKEHFRNLIRNVILNINICREEILLPRDKQILRRAKNLSVSFKNVFKEEYNKPELELFVKYISDDFKKYPLFFGPAGRLEIDEDHINRIYSRFCSIMAIERNKKQKEKIGDLINKAIEKMNESEGYPRSIP